MSRRCSGLLGGNRRRSSGNKLNLPHGQFKATAAMSGTGHSHQFGTAQVTATAALSSSGGMLGLLGTGATAATAALTGSGTVVSNTYSFFYPSTSGPSSGISYSGNFLAGLQFKVTASGHSLLGYYWWVQAGTNPNPTAAQKFALYTWVPSTWSLVSAGTVTSGTLSAGWNRVNLGSGVALTSGQLYEVTTGFTGNFNDTTNQFGTGDPYATGITNGPIFAFSDVPGATFSPSNNNQGLFGTAGNDPTVNQPLTGDVHSNFWIDVIVQ
jgi:hypothetical protein